MSVHFLNLFKIVIPFILGNSMSTPLSLFTALKRDFPADGDKISHTKRSILMPFLALALFISGQILVSLPQTDFDFVGVFNYLYMATAINSNFWMQFLFCFYEVIFFTVLADLQVDVKRFWEKKQTSGTYFETLDRLLQKTEAFQNSFSV